MKRCFRWMLGVFLVGTVSVFCVVPIGVPAVVDLEAPVLKVNERGLFELTEDWSIDVDGKVIVLPAGYASNGITGPAWVEEWAGEGMDHATTHAAIVHDWLILRTRVNRFRADKIFYACLRAGGVPWWKSKVMTHVVLLRSLRHWRHGVRHPGAGAPSWSGDPFE